MFVKCWYFQWFTDEHTLNDSDEIPVNVFQFYSLWNSETLFGPGLITLINKQSV